MSYEVSGWTIYGEHETPKGKNAIILCVQPPELNNLYGWGDQPETRQHLAALTARVRPDMRVADVGTGTGILAIAAAKLGAEVTAYESDPRVASYARRNFKANGVEVELRGAWPDAWDGQEYDLVLANLGDNGPDVMMAGEVIGRA